MEASLPMITEVGVTVCDIRLGRIVKGGRLRYARDATQMSGILLQAKTY